MPRPSDSARRYFRRRAEDVERAGDSVGSNDPGLANRLYAAAGALREFADTYAETTPAPTLGVGDLVRVTFDNGIVTGVDEGTGKIRVGSARYYGGAWFDVGQVSRRG